ncbi:hypothetical protein HPP92_024254 [Vanilla planifolia]|uniref:Fanconi-associated nuclease n=1 Tax=Vanilla planifolia TaxID=51239 RepID=A0A835PRP8_VANPL|nr:hypothetical protein HPP92_024254 [Vanilla planifolia]
MLHGRESLLRLIGKRRRSFSSSLACQLRSQGDSDLRSAEPSRSLEKRTFSRGDKGHDLEWVSCPADGDSVRGSDLAADSNLDECLARGKKRKFNQRTLLQVRFFSEPRGTNPVQVDNAKVNDCEVELHQDNQLFNSFESAEPPGPSLFNLDSGNGISSEESVVGNAAEGEVADPHFSCRFSTNARLPKIDSCQAKHKYFLETCIVGRRFCEKAELQHGARIYVLREPENARDENAIKVLCENQGCKFILGYLPRELARYLSPLIDGHQINCEGSISSIPKNALDSVPITLVCQEVVHQCDLNSEIHEDFELLWEKVLHANESAKVLPISTTKYQQNFCLLLEDVMNNHSQLFTDEEKSFIGSFCSLSGDAQRLFIRLYARKGPWFRSSNISYKEISDLDAAIQELQLTGYLCSFSSEIQSDRYELKDVLDVLTVNELRQLFSKDLAKNGRSPGHKQELVETIVSSYLSGSCPILPKKVLKYAGKLVKISSGSDVIFNRIQRLFFLNGEQDISAFLLVDIGLIKFPEYTCIVTQPIFNCRTDLLEYEEAIEVAQIMDEALDENDMEMISQYEDATRLLKVLLKRIKYDSRRGYWTLRLSVDLEHLGQFNESLSVAEEGIGDPWIRAGSRIAIQRRVLRLGKPPRRWKIPCYAEAVKRKITEVKITGRPLNNETGTKNLFYSYDGELCGVEQLALEYYAGEGGGWQGVHSESGIWMTIFGLLMWDVIFSPVPNVFLSKFQVAPLDLLTDDFYPARKDSMESQIKKIQEGMAEEMLITSWQLHHGTSCHGVNWDKYSLSDLRAAVSCVGGGPLASLCRHLAMDYKSWSSGMPDLLLWRFHGGDLDGGEAKLVEVKGPRDRLSEQQRAWILTLMDCGFVTEVCKVNPFPS